MKKIKMLKTDELLGFKEGEIYEVKPYPYDEKMILMRRVPDGYDPECTTYLESEGDEWEWVKEHNEIKWGGI